MGDFDECLSLPVMHHFLLLLTFQGGLTWLGDYDECLSLPDMHHCLLPWNSSFTKGTPLAPLYTISMVPPSLGACLPSNCTGVDASGIEVNLHQVASQRKTLRIFSGHLLSF